MYASGAFDCDDPFDSEPGPSGGRGRARGGSGRGGGGGKGKGRAGGCGTPAKGKGKKRSSASAEPPECECEGCRHWQGKDQSSQEYADWKFKHEYTASIRISIRLSHSSLSIRLSHRYTVK